LDSAAFNNFLFLKCFLKNCASSKYIKIPHRVLFSEIHWFIWRYCKWSSYAFIHSYSTDTWYRASHDIENRATHFEKIHVTKAPSSIFQALRQEMVTLFGAPSQKAWNDDMVNCLNETTSPSKWGLLCEFVNPTSKKALNSFRFMSENLSSLLSFNKSQNFIMIQ